MGSAAGAYLCAEAAMAGGDYAFAADQFAVSLAGAPNDAGMLAQALQASVLGGRFAVPLAWRLARLEPGNPIAEAVLADDAAFAGAWPAAAQHFAAMSGEGVFALMRRPLLAWAQFASGRHDAMRTLMNPGADGSALGGGYLFQAGLMADLDGRGVDAERFYRTAQADLGPADPGLALALASLLAREGRQAEAAQTLQAAGGMRLGLEIAAGRLRSGLGGRPVRNAADAIAGVYVSFASLARAHEAPDLAELLLHLALNLRPDLTVARLMAADLLEAGHRTASALAMLAPVAANDSLAPAADLRRAAYLERLGRPAEALHVLALLEATVPDRPEPWSLQGALLFRQHRFAESVAAYTSALAAAGGPKRWQDFYGRALAEAAMGPPAAAEAAEADDMAALRLAPDQPAVLTHLAVAWARQGKSLDQARKMMLQAARLAPEDGPVADALGVVELRAGNAAAAVRALQLAVERAPDDPVSNKDLGDAYFAAGRRLEAGFQWQRARAIAAEAHGP